MTNQPASELNSILPQDVLAVFTTAATHIDRVMGYESDNHRAIIMGTYISRFGELISNMMSASLTRKENEVFLKTAGEFLAGLAKEDNLLPLDKQDRDAIRTRSQEALIRLGEVAEKYNFSWPPHLKPTSQTARLASPRPGGHSGGIR